jgi:hypothetical protein
MTDLDLCANYLDPNWPASCLDWAAAQGPKELKGYRDALDEIFYQLSDGTPVPDNMIAEDGYVFLDCWDADENLVLLCIYRDEE